MQFTEVIDAEIQLNLLIAELTMNRLIPLEQLQQQLRQSGNYSIRYARA
ncbi:MAG: hypothetical protein ABI207_05110 [Crocinitomicaceae bacterium]